MLDKRWKFVKSQVERSIFYFKLGHIIVVEEKASMLV